MLGTLCIQTCPSGYYTVNFLYFYLRIKALLVAFSAQLDVNNALVVVVMSAFQTIINKDQHASKYVQAVIML